MLCFSTRIEVLSEPGCGFYLQIILSQSGFKRKMDCFSLSELGLQGL